MEQTILEYEEQTYWSQIQSTYPDIQQIMDIISNNMYDNTYIVIGYLINLYMIHKQTPLIIPKNKIQDQTGYTHSQLYSIFKQIQ